MALTPGTRIGSYEITAQIGVGGMGEVYRARDTKLGRDVAIKVLPEALAQDRERLARFDREARALATLNHPGIAHIYGIADADGSKALVMELVEGPTLADRIAQGPIPVDEALGTASQIAEALEAAHEQGIIHRDLKPANIKVRSDGMVKVLDFGLAKALEPTGAMASNHSLAPTITTPAMTQAGVVLGTPAYMSPEQARGEQVDYRTDVWAFGCVVFELLTGRRAFEGISAADTVAAVLHAEPDWSLLGRAVPLAVRTVLRLCLRKSRGERLAHFQDLRLALEGAFEPSSDGTEASRPSRVPLRALAAVGVPAVLVTVGAIAWRTAQSSAAPEVARFSIAAATDAPISYRGALQSVAVSPDGRRLAYGVDVGDVVSRMIYARAMDELDPMLVRGTEDGGAEPFFSPDGETLGFVGGSDRRSLRRVPREGGTALTIQTLDGQPFGMTWAPDDTILFSLLGEPSGLLRLPVRGGRVEQLTVVDADAGEFEHAYPELLPGGERIVFAIRRSDGWHLAVTEIATRDIYELGLTGSTPAYVSTGHLLYGTPNGTLQAIGFDAATGAVTGTDTVTVLDGVAMDVGTAKFALAANGNLAYIPRPSELQRSRRLVFVDREGRETPLDLPAGDYVSPRVSPDRTRLAVTAGDDIWATDLSRLGSLVRVTTNPGRDEYHAWMPDSRRLVFQSERDGGVGLYVKNADGTGAAERVLTYPQGVGAFSGGVASVTADTTLLTFATSFPGTSYDIAVARLRDGTEGNRPWEPLLRTSALEAEPLVSPDGMWLAYTSDETGRNEVYLDRFPNLKERRLVSVGGGAVPRWRSDGRELFYRRLTDGAVMAVSITGDDDMPQVGTPEMLFVGSYVHGVGSNYDTGPDGGFVMVRQSIAPVQIVLVQNWVEELKRLVPVD